MIERYSKQICLEQVGEQGQNILRLASIAVVGVGGLGSPALTYLSAAGIGNISLIDKDVVEMSNLNRQFLFNEHDIGEEKALIGAEKLRAQNKKTIVRATHICLTSENAISLLEGNDLVLGAVDSFSTRSVINQACVTLGIPYIDGGVNGFSGIVVYSNPPNTPCLNCVFPKGLTNKTPTGVLGTTAGIVGTAMANIAILHLLGLINHIAGKLFLFDGLRMQTELLAVSRNELCPVCKGPEYGRQTDKSSVSFADSSFTKGS